MKKLWFSCLILPIFLIGFFIWLQLKVDLNPAIEESLKNVPMYDSNTQQAPFFYMIAFSALPDVDPFQLGKKMYAHGWKGYFETKNKPRMYQHSSDVSDLRAQLLYGKDFTNSADHEVFSELKKIFQKHHFY